MPFRPKNRLKHNPGARLMPQVSKESASQIAVDYLKKKKNTEKIDVAAVEQQDDGFIVRGTCPIDLEGHQWAEKFEVVIDLKGKVKSEYSNLL
jgi:hypothetical protein